MSTTPPDAKEAPDRPTRGSTLAQGVPAREHGARDRGHGTAALLALASAVLGLAACQPATGPGEEGPPPRIDELPRGLTGAEEEAIGASNAFGFRMLAELDPGSPGDGEVGENTFISPFSASMALGMAMNGAEGETLDGVREALALGDLSQEEANRAYADLLRLLRELDERVDLRVANSMWLQDRYPIRPDFTDRVETHFDAEVANVDFLGAPGAAADRINRWVADATDGEIAELVDASMLGDLIALLANAVYFQGDWRSQFDPSRTREGTFRRPDGSTVQVPMMQGEDVEARYGRSEDFLAADLPYGGAAFSMTIVLPPEGVALDSLVESLDAESWGRIVGSLGEGERAVMLPKFEMRYDTLLNGALRAMGMDAAFDPSRADFSRMSDRALQDRLHIQWVKQKSFVRVDEEGTTAAAATGVGVGVTSAPPAFRVDRPFLFAIRERLSGTILFLGKIVDPPAGSGAG